MPAYVDQLTKHLRIYHQRRAVKHAFDAAFYRATYPDLQGADPLNHYLRSGWKEGRDPRPDFSTRYYLAAHPDVRDAGVNPFYHYVSAGKSEGRSIRPAGYAPKRTLNRAALPPLPVQSDNSLAGLRDFLKPLRNPETGIYEITPSRRFMHDETQYDDQYQHSGLDVRPGLALVELLSSDGRSLEGPALELGCGTGFLSGGLVASGKCRPLLITDASDVFIDIVKRKLQQQGPVPDQVMLGVLNGEDLGSLPSGLFSLIVMRAVLHHFTDVEGFFADAARLLVPGGTLTFYEPCAEGFILMGALASLLPSLAEGAGRPLTKQQRQSIERFVGGMTFYTRADVDKSAAEDKHAFRFDLLSQLAHENGFTIRYVPDSTQRNFELSFTGYLRSCMGFDDELLGLVVKHLRSALDFVEGSARGTIPPSIIGHFICDKVR